VSMKRIRRVSRGASEIAAAEAAAIALLSGRVVMRRGELWWADLPAPAADARYCSFPERGYAVRELVIIAPVTTRVVGSDEVALDKKVGLPKASVVNLDTLATIPKRTLASGSRSYPRRRCGMSMTR